MMERPEKLPEAKFLLIGWSAGPRRPRLVIVIRSLKSWQTIRYQTRIFCLVSIRLANQLTMLHLRLNS